MPSQLDGIRPRPGFFSYLGALGGCLDYLGIEASPAWLCGGLGTAFVMNMQAKVDVACPVAWDGLCVNLCQPDGLGMMVRLGPNLGFGLRAACGCAYGQHRDLEAARQQAWDLARESLDQGLPCFGFELAWPEFFVINGYTDEGYCFVMPGEAGKPETVAGPKAWRELGVGVGWVRVHAVSRGSAAPDDVVVREALTAATACMTRPPGKNEYIMGLVGYDMWADALEQGLADSFGHRYNAAAWSELKAHAAPFLREARQRLPGRADALLDEAQGHYQVVADRLQAVTALHPFMDVQGECLQSSEAAALVRQAGAAERQGFPLLARIVEALT